MLSLTESGFPEGTMARFLVIFGLVLAVADTASAQCCRSRCYAPPEDPAVVAARQKAKQERDYKYGLVFGGMGIVAGGVWVARFVRETATAQRPGNGFDWNDLDVKL